MWTANAETKRYQLLGRKAMTKLDIQKTKITVSGPITSWKIDGETMETVTDYFLGLQNHCRL